MPDLFVMKIVPGAESQYFAVMADNEHFARHAIATFFDECADYTEKKVEFVNKRVTRACEKRLRLNEGKAIRLNVEDEPDATAILEVVAADARAKPAR